MSQQSEERARKLGGQNLTVPDGKNDRRTADSAPTKNDPDARRWTELLVIDKVEFKYAQTAEEQQEEFEGIAIQFRVSDQVPSVNSSERVFERMNIEWKRADINVAETRMAADSKDKEAQQALGKFQQAQMSSRRVSSLLRALGHEDRLINRSLYQGLDTIIDLKDVLVGRLVQATITQGQDKDGVLRDNIQKYAAK
jgi:hypothetical protein